MAYIQVTPSMPAPMKTEFGVNGYRILFLQNLHSVTVIIVYTFSRIFVNYWLIVFLIEIPCSFSAEKNADFISVYILAYFTKITCSKV